MGSYEAMNEMTEWSNSVDPDQNAPSLNEQVLRENIQ